eukprot:TRINITY_DN1275_c0_g1_i9.p1 TRINITY_DN1275_c0_g1~~TRINITY_DN1275_c0_g1_i9.p1  ORF type:complete len:131 (+),score=42.07 TRINITY_DN1275_c0_g1_i9:117-509(+)
MMITPMIDIPFRDSKLTRLLQSSLGGNSRTCVVCAMTPALQHVDESVSTLRFATRAKKIVNVAKVNEVMDDQAMLKRLRREIEELKEELASRDSGGADTSELKKVGFSLSLSLSSLSLRVYLYSYLIPYL